MKCSFVQKKIWLKDKFILLDSVFKALQTLCRMVQCVYLSMSKVAYECLISRKGNLTGSYIGIGMPHVEL